MKIQCSACEAAEARVFCCADEAALCVACDENIHSANKLVSKHQRVPLSSSASTLPKCDICQDTCGYCICLEDRALFCRRCDVAIHTMNNLVSGHQRLLLTGVKVGVEASWNKLPPTTEKLHTETVAARPLMRAKPVSFYPPAGAAIANKDGKAIENRILEAPKLLLAPGTETSSSADGFCKETLDFANTNPTIVLVEKFPHSQSGTLASCLDLTHSHTESEPVAVKAEDKVPGTSEWLGILRSTEEELLNDRSAKVDDLFWTVPKVLRSQYFLSGSQSMADASHTSSSSMRNTGDTSNISSSNGRSHAHVGNDSKSCQNSTAASRRSHQKQEA